MDEENLLKLLLESLSAKLFSTTTLKDLIEENDFKEEYIKMIVCLKLTYDKNNEILIDNIFNNITPTLLLDKKEYNQYTNTLTHDNKLKFIKILSILNLKDIDCQMKLFKKCFKNIYQFVNNNDNINIMEVLPICYNISDFKENYVETEMLYDVCIIIYLSELLEKSCRFNDKIEKFLLIHTKDTLQLEKLSYKEIKTELKNNKDKIKFLKSLYRVDDTPIVNGEQYITTVKTRACQEEIPNILNEIFDLNDNHESASMSYEKKIFRQKSSEIKEVIVAFENFLQYHNLSLKELSLNTKYTSQDFNELWYFNIDCPIILENDIDTNWIFQYNIYFTALYFIKLLIKNIRYYENKYVLTLKDNEKLISKIENTTIENVKNIAIQPTINDEKQEIIKNKYSELKSNHSILQTQYSTLQKDYNKLQRDYNKLLKEIEDNHNYKKEVIALREYVYKHQEEETITPQISTQDMIDFFSTKKCLMLGGRPTWINRLKEILPNFDYMEKEDINRKFKDLDKIDYLFLNTSYFNHPFYYKLMNEVNKYSVKLVYLTGYSNVDRTIHEMYSQK